MTNTHLWTNWLVIIIIGRLQGPAVYLLIFMKSKAKAKSWTFHETNQIAIWVDSESSLVQLFSTTKSNVESKSNCRS